MRKTALFLAAMTLAGGMLAGSAAGAASHETAANNVEIVALTRPGMDLHRHVQKICAVFFAPGEAGLTPEARKVIATAAHMAASGKHVAIVMAEPAGEADHATAELWHRRYRAVWLALHSPEEKFAQL